MTDRKEYAGRLCVAANEADAAEVAGGRDRPIVYGPHHFSGLMAAAELAASDERVRLVDDLMEAALQMIQSANAIDELGEHEDAHARRLASLLLRELSVSLRVRGDFWGLSRDCSRCARYDEQKEDCSRTKQCLPGRGLFVRKVILPEEGNKADAPKCEWNQIVDQLQQVTGRMYEPLRVPSGTPLIVSKMLPWEIAVIVHPRVQEVARITTRKVNP